MDWPFFFELAINGALSGLMYSLVALGIVLIYKSSSVPNLAQGALAMLGAYVVLALFETMKLPIWAALAAGMVVMFGIGMGIERVALRRLAGRPLIMILMMTLALDIFVRASALVAWGGTNRVLPLPISADPLFIGPVLVNRSYVAGGVIALSLFGFFVLSYVVVRFLVDGNSVPGFPFLASIIAIFSGVQLFALGIIGEYLARMHFRSMDRPSYVVREHVGFQRAIRKRESPLGAARTMKDPLPPDGESTIPLHETTDDYPRETP